MSDMLRLSPKLWSEKVTAYAAAKRAQKDADTAARSAKAAADNLKSEILSAMGSNTTALCGNAVITVKNGAPADATVTTTDGRTIKLADITGVLIGNDLIPRDKISKMFGGREGSISIEVAGA
jgi:hypothetical protein